MGKTKILVIVDMQNDFIAGSLGSPEAQALVPKIVEKIKTDAKKYNLSVITTQDIHFDNYLDTREGKNLPVKHCIVSTEGQNINKVIYKTLWDLSQDNIIDWNLLVKLTFGHNSLAEIIKKQFDDDINYDIEVVGLCTDYCVLANTVVLLNGFPDKKIIINEDLVVGTSLETHNRALDVMESLNATIVRKGE